MMYPRMMAFASSILLVHAAAAQSPPPAEPPPSVPPSLKTLPVPEIPNLSDFVQDPGALVALGKALFWDQQVGSDLQACASCHFHAGADRRAKNQLNPGLLRVDASRQSAPDTGFGDASGLTGSGAAVGPNYTLMPEDFPLHRLADPGDRESAVLFDMNDTVSSQGTYDGGFVSIGRPVSATGAGAGPGRLRVGLRPRLERLFDFCKGTADSIFHVGAYGTRKVEPRNTPTTINAAYNHRNFWDGRANNVFNGLDPFGPRTYQANPAAGILKRNLDGTVSKVQVALLNSSLASQAVGPPLSDFEMTCSGQTFGSLGRRLLSRRPLALQVVSGTDSVLGKLRGPLGRGLTGSYAAYVQRAFKPEYWSATALFDGFTQMESNFPLFFGLAVQAYERTLVSNDAKYDRVQEGHAQFTAAEAAGLDIFMGKGKCIACHTGALFTGAAVDQRRNEIIERMPMGFGGNAVYDGGFYNIGVRPAGQDLGVGGKDPYGNPLSFARQAVTGNPIDPLRDNFSSFDPGLFEVPGAIQPGERVAVDGAFKVPTLRNVELTGPYFHTGSQATLRQVVEFYNRGGDRRSVSGCAGPGAADTSGLAENCSNVDPDIERLGLTETEQDGLVAFLLTLTDPRVKFERAPFDHPQLRVPDGHVGDQNAVRGIGARALSRFIQIPAVGARGRATPLDSFLGLSPFQP